MIVSRSLLRDPFQRLEAAKDGQASVPPSSIRSLVRETTISVYYIRRGYAPRDASSAALDFVSTYLH